MPSFSFDSLATIYDATRGYPPGVDQQIARDLLQFVQATPQTRFLEVGIGTGRVSFPLASQGHDVTGVDISQKMVELLIEKLRSSGWQEEQQPWGSLPDEDTSRLRQVMRFRQSEPPALMRLVISDMTELPFHDSSFDIVLAVHVFHLVENWQQALREVLRVLHPGGLFLHCWDEILNSDKWPVGETWVKIIHEMGGKVRPGNRQYRSLITEWLREQGLHPEIIPLTSWEIIHTPRQAVEHVTKRRWSSTRMVPDDLFETSVPRLEAWAKDYFGDQMDVPQPGIQQFVVCKTEVPSHA